MANIDNHDTGDFNAPQQAEKKHPVWSIEGIPAPTEKDLKWWEKQKDKYGKTKFKSCYRAVKKRQLWRLAKLMEFRDGSNFSNCQYTYNLFGNWDPNHAVAKHLEPSEIRPYMEVLFCGGMTKWAYNSLGKCQELEDWDTLRAVGKYSPQTVFWSLQNAGKIDIIKEIIQECGHNEKIIEYYALHDPDPDILKFALKFTPYTKNEDVYSETLKDSLEIFEILCLAKYEHELNGGRAYPIPLADQYIEKNFAKHKVVSATINSAEWEKQSDHTIYRNHPVESNGSRLRDHFDFAIGRIVRIQQMPDGTYNHVLNWTMQETFGTKAFNDATRELRKAGGNPDVFDVSSAQKNAATAKPPPVAKAP